MAQLPKPVKGARKKKQKSLAKRLDDLARELCHARGTCEARGWREAPGETGCGGPLQWAHILSRAARRNNLRWRMDNCLLLCRDHHFRWTKKNEVEWRAFLYSTVGVSTIVNLEHEADQGAKPDHKAALAYLEELKARLAC